jgi:hypothetical protein
MPGSWTLLSILSATTRAMQRVHLPFFSIHNPVKLDSTIQLWQEFPVFTGQPALSEDRGFLQDTQYLYFMTRGDLPGTRMSSNGPFPW